MHLSAHYATTDIPPPSLIIIVSLISNHSIGMLSLTDIRYKHLPQSGANKRPPGKHFHIYQYKILIKIAHFAACLSVCRSVGLSPSSSIPFYAIPVVLKSQTMTGQIYASHHMVH